MRIRIGRAANVGVGCLILIPVFFLLLGGAWLFFSVSRVTSQVTGAGVVVDVASRTDSDGGRTYRPVIEFVAADGQTYRFTGRTGSSSQPDVGGTIEVLYDPADPTGATEKTFVNLWLFPIVFGGVGLIFIAGMIVARNRARDRAVDTGSGSGGVADAISRTLYGDGASGERTDTGPSSAGSPVGGLTAVFRRAESTIAADGSFRYRIVAKDDAGNEYYSELLDDDPTVLIMQRGNEVQLVERAGRWVVHFEPESG